MITDAARLQELAAISAKLEVEPPQNILRWAMQTFGNKLTMATAFGPEGCCLIAMIAGLRDELGFGVDIFNIDTGYQFQETLELRERLIEKYELPIRFVRPQESVEEVEARLGGPMCLMDPQNCCYQRKVVPLADAVEGFDAWITAIRRDQTPERASQPIVGPESKFHMVKINPLANWNKDMVWDYARSHDVPTNPLHDQGYASIGCWPATRPIAPGEDERAGRWAGTDKRECGLHLSGGKLVRVTDTVSGTV